MNYEGLAIALMVWLAGIGGYLIGHRQGVKAAERDVRESDRRYQESIKSWKGEL